MAVRRFLHDMNNRPSGNLVPVLIAILAAVAFVDWLSKKWPW